VTLPPVPAAPAPAVPAAPLALPELRAMLPMFEIVFPVTLPVRFAVALADEVLKLLEKFEVAVPPLLAATAPVSVAAPELWLLLSVLVVVFVVVLVLLLLLSCVLLSCELLSCVLLLVLVVVFVVVAVLVFVL
jgi:hypothetical protein